MSLFSFDVRDEGDSFEDEDGIECATLKRGRIPHGFRSALLAWEMLPDSSHRSFVVNGRYFVTLASAWTVDDVRGEPQLGEDRWKAALDRAKLRVEVLRRELAEDSSRMKGLDSLLSVVQPEASPSAPPLASRRRLLEHARNQLSRSVDGRTFAKRHYRFQAGSVLKFVELLSIFHAPSIFSNAR
ncbi:MULTISPECIES: hypothetical protein [Mesorhizobium]|uniref:hypothetical protein n=1 Tax=Mesorhizobium TaxID=68287 RepID=UPI001FCE514E|nr:MULTISPECIES: hypothetical protein [Mesorhizobium]